MKHAYGYKRRLGSHKDFRYAFSGNPITVPTTFDLPSWDNVFDQGNIGSCVLNAASWNIKSWMVRHNYPNPFVPSRLKAYYDVRYFEGTVNQDSGCAPQDALDVMNASGVCPEDETSSWNWAYDVTKIYEQPPSQCYTDAKLHKLMQYAQVNQDELSIKSALVNGFNLLIGISVFEQIESKAAAQTGVIAMPGANDDPIGGHGLAVKGYDTQFIYGPNSWSNSWGAKGYYYLPWDYVLNPDLCTDILTIGMIT